MRLFTAIDFNNQEYFKAIQDQIPKDLARSTFPKTFHLTLKFLGEVPEDKIDEIKEKLSSVKFEPFKVKINNIGFFPSENYVKVIWLGFKDNEKINELQQKVENSLLNIFPKDSRFHPHITLARVKFIKEKEEFIKKLKEIKIEPKEAEIKDFKLIKSILGKEGPVYEELENFGG